MSSKLNRKSRVVENNVSVNETIQYSDRISHTLKAKLRRIEITLELGRDSDELRRKEAHLKDLLGIEN